MQNSPATPTHRGLMASGGFRTTRWTQVIQAKERTHEGSDALRDLCAAYYSPVIAFLRRRGHSAEEARELAHEFFAGMLEGESVGGADRLRGRFRSYLLGAVKHFLSHVRESEHRVKRGAGVKPLSIDEEGDDSPALAIADDERLSPDALFDRRWALAILGHALQTLRAECAREGGESIFERACPLLTGDASHGDQAALADSLGMNINSFKSAVFRLKRRFRVLVKQEVAATLEDDQAVEEEMSALFAALRGG